MKRTPALIFIFAISCGAALRASNLDTIGLTLLRAVATNLDGSGIPVAQAEASLTSDLLTWEVNPTIVGQPVSHFDYISAEGSTNVFPNTVGAESGHADEVAKNFYNLNGGIVPNVAHVDNIEADYFYSNYVAADSLPAIGDLLVNQSFIFCNPDYSHLSVSDEQMVDSQYDNYAAQNQILFISGAGNGGPTNQAQVYPAATCYNGIGVAAYGGSSCTGPTLDNGRCKPDITAPAGATSYSTPQVSGAVALLLQAGLRGDGGGDTNSAADIRTVKTLLLNGAVKPSDWTNQAPSPLDFRYGAGVLNVFNSYEQMAGGKRGWNFSTNIPAGMPHPPVAITNSISVLSGWDFSTNASSSTADGANHYFFNVTNNAGNATFAATATLVWNRQQGQTNINNLDLFLYNCASSNLVACSTSLVDNVEHIFVPRLPQGRYDLQVWKAGGSNIVSTAENYALAWEFFSESLNAAKSATNLALSWPVYPDGFHVEAAASLSPPQSWSTDNLPPPVFTNNQNVVVVGATNAAQFFRLRTP